MNVDRRCTGGGATSCKRVCSLADLDACSRQSVPGGRRLEGGAAPSRACVPASQRVRAKACLIRNDFT
eukprot:397723-Pleurochrysis_carterae.AAC.2